MSILLIQVIFSFLRKYTDNYHNDLGPSSATTCPLTGDTDGAPTPAFPPFRFLPQRSISLSTLRPATTKNGNTDNDELEDNDAHPASTQPTKPSSGMIIKLKIPKLAAPSSSEPLSKANENIPKPRPTESKTVSAMADRIEAEIKALGAIPGLGPENKILKEAIDDRTRTLEKDLRGGFCRGFWRSRSTLHQEKWRFP